MQNFFEIPKKISTLFPEKYSIDLMWINRTLDENKPFITDDLSEQELVDNVINKAIQWKKENPGADVSIWYDSKFVTPEALAATEKILNSKIADAPLFSVKLRDIRQLDLVANNPDIFTDFVPLYFRVDLLKLIICINAIVSEAKQAAIFADLSVCDSRAREGKTPRMGKEELFNDIIMDKLDVLGIQVHECDNGYENQFFQIINKPETINAIKVFINANLARAAMALNLYKTDKEKYYHTLPSLCTCVFSTMRYQLFPFLLGLLKQRLTLTENTPDSYTPVTKIPYQPEIHGHLPLGNYFNNRNPYSALVVEGLDLPNALFSTQKLNLIEFIPEVDNYTFGRDDLDTRSGNHKNEDLKNLHERLPADGSDTYKYKPLNIHEMTISNEQMMKL